MAFSTSTYGSYMTGYHTAGRSFMLGRNIAEDSTLAVWVDGTSFGTDDELLSRPASCAIDGRPWTLSGPSGSGTDKDYSLFLKIDTDQYNASFDSFNCFGFIAIEELSLGSTPRFVISVANDSSGAPGAFTEAQAISLSGSVYRQSAFLYNGSAHYRYNNVEWIRLTWEDLDAPPVIGQVFFGLADPIVAEPMRPYDSSKIGRSVQRLPLNGRRIYNYAEDSGFADNSLRYVISGLVDGGVSTPLYWFNQFWEKNEQGARVMYFWQGPTSGANFTCNLVSSDLPLAYTEAHVVETEMALTELPPYKAVFA